MESEQVKIFEYTRVAGETSKRLHHTGTGDFCGFGCDYEEFETGAGNYSTAIVRMADGTMKNPPVVNVQFIQKGMPEYKE